MESQEVICPLCSSDEAGVAYRGQSRTGYYCPYCDQAWEVPPTVLNDPKTLRAVMRAAFNDRTRDQTIGRGIPRHVVPKHD